MSYNSFESVVRCRGRRITRISASGPQMFSRRSVRQIRACNLVAGLHQIPMPTSGEDFEWLAVTGNDATPFSGPVYSMDVDKDQHYVAGGLVTHNCRYAVKGRGHWSGDRTQSTLWSIPSRHLDAATVHGPHKPVECMRRPMLNHASPGQPRSGPGRRLMPPKPIVLTDHQRQEVETLAALLNQEQIADYLGIGRTRAWAVASASGRPSPRQIAASGETS